MSNSLPAIAGACLLASAPFVLAQIPSTQAAPSESAIHSESGVPIERLVAVVAKKTGKKFVVDPRVHGAVVLVGLEPSDIGYAEFLSVLSVYGYAAVEAGKLVELIPDAAIRSQAVPTISPKDTRAPDEYVTQIIPLKNISAPTLVPVLRPMLPQNAHLVATAGNSLMISDRFANLRRIEGLARALDSAEAGRPHAGGEGTAQGNPEAKP
jgi:general secretion pathway protein D